MDQEDLRRKRRRMFEQDAANFIDSTADSANFATNTGANSSGSHHADLHFSGVNHSTASIDSANLESLVNMGFNIKTANKALQSAGGDVQRAVEVLFSNSNDDDEVKDATHSPALQHSNHDDEALARHLQREYDQEGSLHFETSTPASRVDSAISDEAYARSLQSHLNDTADDPRREAHATSSRSSGALPEVEPSIRPGEVEDTVRSIAEAITGVKCHDCRKYIVKNETHILAFSKYIQDSEGRLIAIPCQSCRNTHHDKRARLYMIWALLCDFDANSKQNRPDKRRGNKTAKRTTGNGTGYSGGYSFSATQSASVNKKTTAQSLDVDDNMTATIMNTLHVNLLPTFDREDEFELDEKQLQSLFLCSSLLERVAELLRNNDLEEVTRQKTLYDALARLLQTLAMHPSTSALVFGNRTVRSSGASLLKISMGKASLAGGKEVDTVQPLSQCLQDFAVQCSLMLSHSTSATESQLFQAFIDLRDFLQANGSSAGSSATKASKEDKDAWHKEYAVSEIPDEYILENHYLASKTQASGSLAPGRMKRIMQEISRLHTSLPSGIFVRYGSSRPDVLKIIIIGPDGTPYENGLFEFDLLCGNNFPTDPPQMQLRTTGNGAVRFNPNLYNCGKVCLSLLGTWEGEKWDARQSTLLQVLVSIQAMIFCDLPWFNEPGRGASNAKNQQSISYNKSLYPHTVQHAMLPWLDDGYQEDENIWSGIVQKHFLANKDGIRDTICKWTGETGIGVPGNLVQYLRAAVPKLKKTVPNGGRGYDY